MIEGLGQHKIFFVVNPQAGGGKGEQHWQGLLPALQELGLDFFWQYSQGGPYTAQQVRQAVLRQGATAVIAVGGDGHVHDTLNGVIDNDALIRPQLVFGVFPAGSACDFARMIYPRDGDTSAKGLLRLLRQGRISPVDVGRADFQDHQGAAHCAYFVNGSDIGLGADTCLRVNAQGGELKRRLKNGQLAFFLAALHALFNYHYCPLEIQADGETLDGQYLIAALGNGRFMGGNMQLFPQARLDDGLLDLLLVRRMPLWRVLLLFAKVYNGSLLEIDEVIYRQVAGAEIRPQQPLPLELDGELPGQAPYQVRILPGLLPLLQF